MKDNANFSVQLQRGSVRVQRGSIGCGAALLRRVWGGTDSSVSPCCKAGPSTNFGLAPLGPLLSRSYEENKSTRRVIYM
jgi:hypothetical protein